MIDFIRIQYKDKSVIEPFVMLEDNFKELTTTLVYHTGEIQYPYKVSIKNMDISVNRHFVYVKNSLHKLNNVLSGDGNQNHNDFGYDSLCKVIDFLCANLVGLDHADITQLEFGLNIEVPKPAEVIIRENIIMHNYKGCSHNTTFQGRGEFRQFDYSNYYIKIYDKAKQYKVDKNILRFEVKFIRKKEFNKLDVRFIDHLKSKESLGLLFQYLLKRFDEMVIVDDMNDVDIPSEDCRLIESYLSSRFWDEIISNGNRNKKAEHKKVFNGLLIKYDLLNMKREMKQFLEDKYQELINN